MELAQIAQALALDDAFLRRRIEQLQKELEFCRQLFDAVSRGTDEMTAVDTPQEVYPPLQYRAGLRRTHRLTRSEYYQAAIAFLSKQRSASAREVYEHMAAMGKPVTYDSVAAFLRREFISETSRITKDPLRPGSYVLRGSR